MPLQHSAAAESSGRFAHRYRTRLLTLAVVVATAAATLAGCSSSSETGGPQTITFYSWDNAQLMKPIIAAFEKKHPEIKVQTSYGSPVEGYISTLQTRLSSGTAADVFIITAENKVDLMKHKLVSPLEGQPYVGTLADAAKSTYSQGGHLYGAAVASWGGGIVYNKDLLAKVGVTEPPQTWDEFLDICSKLQSAGITPFYEAGDQIPNTVSALVGLENDKLKGKMDAQIWAGQTTFAKTWTPAITRWASIFDKGLESRSVAGLTTDQVLAEFEKGQVAMTSTGSWATSAIESAAPDLHFGFWAVPGASATYWSGAVSPGYAVNAKSKHAAAAKKFIAFLVGAEAVKLYQKETGSITTTSNFTPTLASQLDEMVPDVRAGRFYLPQTSWPSDSAALNSEATSLLQQVMSGQISPKQLGQQMDAKLASLRG